MMHRDYHGQLDLNVTSRYANRLAYVLRLVLEPKPIPQMFTGFSVIQATWGGTTIKPVLGKGPEWLVLWTAASPVSKDDRPVTPFIAPISAEAAAASSGTWLTLKDPWHDRPGIDGTVEPGAFHAVAGWDVEDAFGVGAAIAIRRVWAVYGK